MRRVRSRPSPFATALLVPLLSSCVTVGTGTESPVLHGMAACAGDFCAPGVDDIEQGAALFEQLGRDAEKVREHLSDVSDRSRLFGPDIRRLQRMFDGFQQIKAEGSERLRRRDRAGAWARLNALMLGLPVITLQLEYLATASRAEDAGVVSTHWLDMLNGMKAETEPVLQAMVDFDVRRMNAAAGTHRQGLARLQTDLPEIQKTMNVGALWSERGLFWANALMAAASAYEMAVAFRGMGSGPGGGVGLRFPALVGAGASGGRVVVLSAEMMEGLRELIRIGALGDQIVATIAAMTGKPDLPGGQSVAPAGPSRTYPSKPPDSSAEPRGKPELAGPKDLDGRLSRQRQNEAAVRLARAGYDVERLPPSKAPRQRTPDFRIEGREFDNYAPTTDRARNIWDYIDADKVNPKGKSPQARRSS